jgi:hypothetical protein
VIGKIHNSFFIMKITPPFCLQFIGPFIRAYQSLQRISQTNTEGNGKSRSDITEWKVTEK